jgi:hypothetical protein
MIEKDYEIPVKLMILAREVEPFEGGFSQQLSLRIYTELKKNFSAFSNDLVTRLLKRIVSSPTSAKGLDLKCINYIGHVLVTEKKLPTD